MQAVAVDGAGAAVAAGYFYSSSATFGGVTLTNAGSSDAVLWKMSAEGTTLWAVRGGGTSSDQLYGVTVDGAGAVLAAGSFGSSSATFGGVALTNAGSGNDAVVWKMSGEGTTLWAVSGGGTSYKYMRAVAVDGAGAVVAAGYFRSSTATFGDVALTNTGSGYDAVLWKQSADGTTLWAVRGGGTSTEYLYGVAVDGAGAVVAAGFFSTTATFGGVALTTAGSYDAVLWKVNAEGTTLWAVRGGGTSSDGLSGAAVDGAGAVVAAGAFGGSLATFGGVAVTNAGYNNAILWKMNAEGTTLWAVRGGGTEYTHLYGVAVDSVNDVVAAGYFSSSTATFGDVALTNAKSTSYTNDAVLWKVTDEGTTRWAVRVGGTGYADQLNGVAVDIANTVVAAGFFDSSPAAFEGVNLTNAGGYDAVVWKVFNTMQPPSPPPPLSPPSPPPSPPPLPSPPPPSYDLVTTSAFSGGGYMSAVAVDGTRAMVSAGYFFDSATFGGVALTSAGSGDAVVWKQSAEGTTLWAVRGGGTEYDRQYGVAVDGAGAVVAAGLFRSWATFGSVTLTSVGNSDAVVWKMSAEGTTLWAVRGGSTGSDQLYGVAVDKAGAVVAAGYFGGSFASSSTATFGNLALTTAGHEDWLLWKVSAKGTTLWAVRGGGTGYDYLQAVAVDGAGAVVAAGYFQSTPATFGGVALTADGSHDAALWKMSAEGTTLWAVRGGGTDYDILSGVATDGMGAVVAAGNFRSSPAMFGAVNLTNAAHNVMVWKLSAEGTTLWAVSGGGKNEDEYLPSNDMLNGVAVDNANAVVVAGSLANSMGTFGDRVLIRAATGGYSGYSDDAVLWKVNAEGTTLWAIRAGGTGDDKLYDVAVDGVGASVAAGTFSSPATFGDEVLTTGDSVVWKVSDNVGLTYS